MDTVSFGPCCYGHWFSHFEESSSWPAIKVHLEIRFNFAVFCLIFNHLLKSLFFKCAYLTKTSVDGVSVTCKLAMKWYLNVDMLQLTVSLESKSPSLGVYSYLNYSCPSLFTDPSILSLNLPRIQISQEPQ